MMGSTATPSGHAWRRPRIALRPALWMLALCLGVGLVQGAAVQIGMSAQGWTGPSYVVFVGQLTSAVGAWAALPAIQFAVLNASGPGVRWPRIAAFHVAGYLGFTAIHIAVLVVLRALGRRLGLTLPSSTATFRILWEAQNDIIVYGSLAGLWTVLHAWERLRTEAVRAAQLEARLTAARLDALVARLDPHFLFNALNTVSAVMYEDLPRTERLIAGLGELLRATLSPGAGAAWTLAEERAHTERYLELVTARFGERIRVSWHAMEGLGEARVPRLAVQTLVENAIKHNRDREAPLTIRIDATKDATDGAFIVVVSDDGRGFSADALNGAGRGLDRLEETLRLLHGDEGWLERTAAPGGGARVTLRLPREASEARHERKELAG